MSVIFFFLTIGQDEVNYHENDGGKDHNKQHGFRCNFLSLKNGITVQTIRDAFHYFFRKTAGAHLFKNAPKHMIFQKGGSVGAGNKRKHLLKA